MVNPKEVFGSIYADGKVFVPSEIRAVLAERNVLEMKITRGMDGCLWLFSVLEWEDGKARSIRGMEAHKDYIEIIEEMHKNAHRTMLKDEFLEIPAEYSSYAELKEKIVWVVRPDRLQLWSEDRWIKERKDKEPWKGRY